MEQGKIKQGFANEVIATLNVGIQEFKIEYNRDNDTFELLERCEHYDYLVETGDLFTVVNHLLELYDANI